MCIFVHISVIQQAHQTIIPRSSNWKNLTQDMEVSASQEVF